MASFRTLPAALAIALLSGSCSEQTRIYSTQGRATLAVHEAFSGPSPLARWRDTAGSAKSPEPIPPAVIQNGRLRLEGRRNHPLWLKTPLPRFFRLEIDVWPLSYEGDVKIEIAGDGQSFGRGGRYRPSGYVLIYGGWNGARHLIARQDEHGDELVSRTAISIDAGRRHHFRIERRDASIRWFVDGRLILQLLDERPLHGPTARYLGLSGYQAPVAFDNLRVQALPPIP